MTPLALPPVKYCFRCTLPIQCTDFLSCSTYRRGLGLFKAASLSKGTSTRMTCLNRYKREMPWKLLVIPQTSSFSCNTFFPQSRQGASLLRSSASTTLCISHRTYVNILYRLPPENTIPTHSPSGKNIDPELLLQQMREYISTVKMTQLVDSIHEMKNFPYFECFYSRDMLFQHHDLLLPMPKSGREHRNGEISETLRYMRGCGASLDFHHILQDTKGCRANGRDFISTHYGVLVGWGTDRTNKIAMETLSGASGSSKNEPSGVNAMSFEPVELYPDSPPLSDLVAIAGMRTLLTIDDRHGFHAAEQIVQRMPKVHWQVVKIPVGCSFLSHIAGAKYCYDVICDQDFPEALERLGETGLNPFPVQWSEPRKLGISLSSVVLIACFVRGTLNAGGFADNTVHYHSDFNYHSRNVSKNARLFEGGRRRHGDTGAPLEAMLRSGEIDEIVYQPPPRYVPPMHNANHVVPSPTRQ